LKDEQISCAVFNSNGSRIYCGTTHGRVMIVDHHSWTLLDQQLITKNSSVKSIVLSRCGKFLLTNCSDRVVRYIQIKDDDKLQIRDFKIVVISLVGHVFVLSEYIRTALRRKAGVHAVLATTRNMCVQVRCEYVRKRGRKGRGEGRGGRKIAKDSKQNDTAAAHKHTCKISIWRRLSLTYWCEKKSVCFYILKQLCLWLFFFFCEILFVIATLLACLHCHWHPIENILVSVLGNGEILIWSEQRKDNWCAFAPYFQVLNENVWAIHSDNETARKEKEREREKENEKNAKEDIELKNEIDIFTADTFLSNQFSEDELAVDVIVERKINYPNPENCDTGVNKDLDFDLDEPPPLIAYPFIIKTCEKKNDSVCDQKNRQANKNSEPTKKKEKTKKIDKGVTKLQKKEKEKKEKSVKLKERKTLGLQSGVVDKNATECSDHVVAKTNKVKNKYNNQSDPKLVKDADALPQHFVTRSEDENVTSRNDVMMLGLPSPTDIFSHINAAHYSLLSSPFQSVHTPQPFLTTAPNDQAGNTTRVVYMLPGNFDGTLAPNTNPTINDGRSNVNNTDTNKRDASNEIPIALTLSALTSHLSTATSSGINLSSTNPTSTSGPSASGNAFIYASYAPTSVPVSMGVGVPVSTLTVPTISIPFSVGSHPNPPQSQTFAIGQPLHHSNSIANTMQIHYALPTTNVSFVPIPTIPTSNVNMNMNLVGNETSAMGSAQNVIHCLPMHTIQRNKNEFGNICQESNVVPAPTINMPDNNISRKKKHLLENKTQPVTKVCRFEKKGFICSFTEKIKHTKPDSSKHKQSEPGKKSFPPNRR
ncbi:WD-40 repeat-containing protein, partial [Reticulomyxa filosa]